jgi:hypothetical protein
MELLESSRKTPFTLATMVGCFGFLVVGALLTGLVIPWRGSNDGVYRFAAHDDEKQIIKAIKTYYAEYSRFPVDPNTSGVVVFGRNNNALFDVLRNYTGKNAGNALNPRNSIILEIPAARDQKHPKAGLQTATGIWFDPWGSPYHIAIDLNRTGELNGKVPIPGFYSDVGPLKAEVIVWSYGRNGELGGGPAKKTGFIAEPGTPGEYKGSGDIVSWNGAFAQ